MDRRGYWLLGASLALLTAATASADNAGLPLRELNWIASEFRVVAATTQPAAAFQVRENDALDPDMVMAGEAAFHAPTLLGGQAAKAGISCASCHVNGRDNPHFLFPGVSGAPGTADVTHSFFSSRRGDGAFNPIPIPDLAQPGKIDRDDDGALESFIRGLIVEEFDGAEPSPKTLAAVAAYVRALCTACDGSTKPLTLETHWQRAERALQVAERYHKQAPQLTGLALASARHQLGLVHERFADPGLSSARNILVKLSRTIQQIEEHHRAGDALSSDGIGKLLDDVSAAKEILQRREHLSLYSPEILAAALPD